MFHTATRRLLLLCLVASGAGCNSGQDESPPTPSGQISLEPTSLWAGGELTVRSKDFLEFPNARFVLTADTLAFTKVDDTTFTVQVPDTLSGIAAAIVVLNEAHHFEVGTLTIYGYTGEQLHAQALFEDLYVYPRGDNARLMGVGFQAGSPSSQGLVLLNLDTDENQNYPILDGSWLRGPGPTTTPGVFIVRGANDMLRAYNLFPTLTLVDSFPGRLGNRQVMRLGDSVWFTSAHHQFTIGSTTVNPAEETEGVHMSPRFDRATIQIDQLFTTDLPVFSVPGGQVAYTLPLRTSDGVYFSDDGELLAIVGKTVATDVNSRVLLVRASDGTILGDTTITGHGINVALDSDRGYLYLASVQGHAPPQLTVLRQSDFGVVARLRAAPSAAECEIECYKGVVALSAAPAVYIASGANVAGTVAYRFTLPPALPPD